MYSFLIVSRNKDNANVPNFKHREYRFLAEGTDDTRVKRNLEDFVKHGQDRELVRLYMSVNERDLEKTNRDLIKFLVDHPDFDLSKIEAKTVSIANKQENAKTHYWLFDFDCDLPSKLQDFLNDIHNVNTLINMEYSPTPNGFAVITKDSIKFYDNKGYRILVSGGDDIDREESKDIIWYVVKSMK